MANLHTSHEICKFLIQVLKFISKDNFAFYLEVADESRFKDDQIFSTKKLFHTFSTKKLLEVAGSGESRWQGCDKCSLPPDCHDCHDDGHCTIIWRQHNNILNLMSKWAKWPPAFTSREYKHFNWNLLCAAVSLPAGVMSEWFNKDTSGDSSCHLIVLFISIFILTPIDFWGKRLRTYPARVTSCYVIVPLHLLLRKADTSGNINFWHSSKYSTSYYFFSSAFRCFFLAHLHFHSISMLSICTADPYISWAISESSLKADVISPSTPESPVPYLPEIALSVVSAN